MSWLAALGPCASPKSKAKEQRGDGTGRRPLNLSSMKRQGSLTDVRPSRKVTGSRSFREKIQDTFEGSLRRVKKTGSLEAVTPSGRGETFGNPDTNMNVSTSLRPKAYKGSHSGSIQTGVESDTKLPKDKFWTNFYNTLPRNRNKDRPKDLSLQDLPVSERDSDIDLTQNKDSNMKGSPTDGQWQGYATSPRTKRKNKTLERMNSVPSSRKSPMKVAFDTENTRAASDGNASPQIIEITDEELFDSGGSGFVVMPRSVSLQDDYFVPATKGVSRMELRKISASPDRLGVRRSPIGSPVQGHVWVRTKDGSHIEVRAIERHPRDIPSPSDSQKTDSSTATYNMTANSLTSIAMVPKFPVEDRLPGGYSSSTTQTSGSQQDPYMSPEEYQANIFDLINSLNQSPPNPASPEVKRSKEVKLSRSPSDVSKSQGVFMEDGRCFHTEKFILLGNSPGTKPEDYEKREQPIFSVRAHVFQIDPETKKNWLPASKSAVTVAYYYDSARNTYRIISVEGSKAIINSTITPNMAFTKTSQKFGQWSDPRANTVYGLGFGTETDLAKFIEKFKEVKEMTRQQLSHSQSPPTVNGDDSHTSSATTTPRETPTSGRGFFHTRSSSLTSMRDQAPQSPEQKENVNLRERRNSFNTPGSNGSTSPESQLKYENDRLKLALAQSSSNAKKWEIELQTLKNNNARLTAALQESTANVDEWKKQLAGYKDETGRLKKKISELEENQGDSEQVSELQSEVTDLNSKMESLQRDNQYKDQEVDRLQQRLAEMQTRETANGNLQNKIKALEDENRSLHQKTHDLQQLLKEYQSTQDREKDEVIQLQDVLGSKITELYEFHEQILATLRKESNS